MTNLFFSVGNRVNDFVDMKTCWIVVWKTCWIVECGQILTDVFTMPMTKYPLLKTYILYIFCKNLKWMLNNFLVTIIP